MPMDEGKKNSGVMKREVWTACLSLKRGLTPQQQQKIRFQTSFPLEKKKMLLEHCLGIFFSVCEFSQSEDVLLHIIIAPSSMAVRSVPIWAF